MAIGEGRDAKGRFAKGNRGGPGRPKGHAGYSEIVADGVPPAAWRRVVARALADAIKGDATARKWLSDWLMGRPTEFVTHDVSAAAMTLEEWRALAAERRKEVEAC